jgi:hypothetical protein
VILQPAGDPDARQHYADTIAAPVSQERLARFLTDDDLRVLAETYGERPVPTWGVTPGGGNDNKTKWDRIQPGDITLMARSSEIFVSAVVTYKAHNASLARDLWGEDENGATWEYLYFLDEIKPRSISVADLNPIVGYAPRARVQAFNVLNEQQSLEVLATIELLPSNMVPQWEIIDWALQPGDRMQRTALHEQYGGRGQGGIGPSRKSPNVLLFTDPDTGRRHGYLDEWANDGVYNYYGEVSAETSAW